MKYWRSLPKSKHPRNNKSFDTLVKYHTDKLMVPKLYFLKYIASILRPFLLRFQISKSMIPFLAVELDVTLRPLTSLVVKHEAVSNANTPYLLLKLDLGKKENLCNIDHVELGAAVTSALTNLKVKEQVKLKFRKDCVAIVWKLIAKINERWPLKYHIVRNTVCLSPSQMIHNTDISLQGPKNLSKVYTS